MMNLRKKSKKAILSSLVALALSSSMAFAMPQGGTVVAGNVNGVTSGSLANLVSGGTLNVNGSSLIDWNSFSIGEKETLNVIFKGMGNNILVNHVSGGDISNLMGVLNARQGEGSFVLVNPNGIVVGPKAEINVGSLILSTLDVDGMQWLNVLKNGGELEYKNTRDGVIDIQGGNINVEDALRLYGTKIRIADGVTISNGLPLANAENPNARIHPVKENKVEKASILAANNVVENWEIKPKKIGDNVYYSMDVVGDKVTAKPENRIDIGKAVFQNDATEFSLAMRAGSITMNGTKFGTEQNPITNLNIRAFQEMKNTNKGEVSIKTDATNIFGAKDVVINSGTDKLEEKRDIRSANEWFAGKIMIDNSTANMKNAGASIATAKQFAQKSNGDVSFKSDASNLIMIRNSKITMMGTDNEKTKGIEEGTAFIVGGQVKIDKSQAEVNNLEINAATSRKDGDFFDGDDDRIFCATKDNALVIQDSTAKTTGHALFTGGSVSLLGNTEAKVGDGKSFIVAAGDEVGLKFIDERKTQPLKNGEIYGDNLVVANSTVNISKKTIDNQTALDIFPQRTKFDIISNDVRDNSFADLDKFFASLTEVASPDQSQLVEKVGSIINDSTLSNAKKVEKIKEVISQDKEASALMTAVRGQVDNTITAAPQTSTAIPAATSVESTNIAAGEGVMSSNANTVTGTEEKKEK